ncbi:hypothetical protein SASPL_109052 [Salvia splendens]|uniref:UBA domain-containing protein n=1 Tax=Salvia splendens TaxID=180675 RepID=A0A8X9A6R4_SALSN|nr:rhomboid-like protein 20 isoform X2 [Salvia splendens]KAG6430977.1 hypothetical protein SASPL_109052 [Salvia splendens]
MNGGPSGFNNAPVTRTIVIVSALFTIIFGIQGRSRNLGWSYQDIFRKLQIWKLIVSVFGFSSTPELLFGIYLLYYFRVFERQIGSNKYTVFITFSIAISILLEVFALLLLKDPSLNILTSGPYSLIFSSFVPFYFDIPVSTRFHVLNLKFSDKTFIYLAGLQFPEAIASFFSRLSLPSSMGSSTPATGSSRNVVGSAPAYPGRQMEGNYPAPTLSTSMEPPEDSIATLVSMGFDRNSARQALVRARNDINAATNILLESQGH